MALVKILNTEMAVYIMVKETHTARLDLNENFRPDIRIEHASTEGINMESWRSMEDMQKKRIDT